MNIKLALTTVNAIFFYTVDKHLRLHIYEKVMYYYIAYISIQHVYVGVYLTHPITPNTLFNIGRLY